MNSPSYGNRRPRLSAPVLVTLVLLCFGYLTSCEFTWWDDAGTVHHNDLLNPPTLESLRYYWMTPTAGLYVPVTYTVWIALARIAGVDRPDDYGVLLNPAIFHSSNLLLHVGATYFVLLILRRLLQNELSAFFGAALFALHPMQVETVAWVSGMKDGLAWFWAFATVLCFLKAAELQTSRGRSLWRGCWMPLSLLTLSLAVLSKPSAMVTPAAIVALDLLIVRRGSVWRALSDTWPLFLISVAAAVVARDAQFVHHIYHAPLWQRPFIAADAICFYVRQLLWPATLTIDYGRRPQDVMASPFVYVCFALVAISAVLVLRFWRSQPVYAAACAIFVIGIAPVLGFATFQMQYYSTVTDHYVYFSMLGAGLAFGNLLLRWPGPASKAAAGLIITLLGIRSALQTPVWYDSFSLFAHAMKATPKSPMPYTNMAVMYMGMTPPRPQDAEPLVDRAYGIDPKSYFVLDAYGQAKLMLGKVEESKKGWDGLRQLIEAHPEAKGVNTELALRVARRLIIADAIEQAEEWVQIAADNMPKDRAVLNAQVLIKRIKAERAATQPAATTAPAPLPASTPGQ